MTKLHLDGKKNNFYGQKIELRLWRDIPFKECEFCLLSNFRNGDISQTVAQLRVFKLFQTLLLYQWIWKQLESSLILKESCFFAHSIMNIKGVLNWTAWFDYSSSSCMAAYYRGTRNMSVGEGRGGEECRDDHSWGQYIYYIMHRFIKLVVSTTFITSTVNKIWY